MTNVPSLVARSLAYRWASRLFAYPGPELLAALERERAWEEMAQAVAALEGPALGASALEALRGAWLETAGDGDALAAEHTRLFARQVLCPPYESSYGPQQDFSRVQHLAEIAGFYAAFGLRVAEAHKELQDHLSLELEFFSVLHSKEALALERGWGRRAGQCASARQKFREEHLTWLPQFAERLRRHATLAFYPAATAWVEALLALEPSHAFDGPVFTPTRSP